MCVQTTSHLKRAYSVLGTVLALGLLTACNDETGVKADVSLSPIPNLHDALTLRFAGNPEKGERIKYSTFSIIPPQGEHWIDGPPRPEPVLTYFGYQPQASFSKVLPQTASGPHSVIAQVEVMFLTPYDRASAIANPQGYMRYMMNSTVQVDKAGVGRMTAKSVEAKLDDSLGNCFRYDGDFEDHGVFGFPNSAFLLDIHAYVCLDPSSKLVARIMYSQRRPPNVEPVDVTSEGEDFLDSFKFPAAEG